MILWENFAYLADDDRRQQAFQTLKKRIGTTPTQILSASDEALLEVTRHGIMAEQFAAKLRKCAKLVLEQFDGDLRPILRWPLPKAKKALQKFPGIGEPGAEKILLPVGAADPKAVRQRFGSSDGESGNLSANVGRTVDEDRRHESPSPQPARRD